MTNNIRTTVEELHKLINVDNVIGVLNTKDYFRLRDKSRENVMKEALFFARRNIDKWFSIDINRDGKWSEVEKKMYPLLVGELFGIGKKTREKLNKLLTDIDRNGNNGLGHPEPLKGNLAGWWSREIDEKNRLIYKIEDGCIKIYQCRNHYADR